MGLVGWAAAGSAQDAQGALGISRIVPVTSKSGQFYVFGLTGGRDREPREEDDTGEPEASEVRLTPQLVAVACEQIHGALQRTFSFSAPQGRGKFYVYIDRDLGEEAPWISADRFRDRWIYRARLPAHVTQQEFVQVVVKILLLEQAHLQPGPYPVRMPRWLVEGLTRHLRVTSFEPLLLGPQSVWNANARKGDPIRRLRETLREETALTFNELSQPDSTALDDEGGRRRYRFSAHLFVRQLLRRLHETGDGHLFRVFIQRLGSDRNWQTTFLETFSGQFDSLLEVEKWWSLALADFIGRTHGAAFPAEATLRKLREILRPSVEIQAGEDGERTRTEVTVQELIEKSDFVTHHGSIREIQNQLFILQKQAAPSLYGLVAEYRQTLRDYLDQRTGPDYFPFRQGPSKTLRRLSELDKRLRAAEQRHPTRTRR